MRRAWIGLLGGLMLLALSPVNAETARGTVFEDRNGNGLRDPGESGVKGVAVSNGSEVVATGQDGGYEIELRPGDVLFVTKPSGYAVPVNRDNLPRFHYVHEPGGSPDSLGLRYEGVRPTGPLPEAIDFPLTPVEEPERFDVILFADPQPQADAEVTFIRDDVVEELIGVDAAFGLTLGDIMYDDLSLLPRYNRIVAKIGIPWYNVPGNHDLNYLAPDDDSSLETFKRVFGPTYFSFDVGRAHFVVLDTVYYHGSGEGFEEPQPRGQGSYEGRISERQLRWLANDLERVPRDRLIVLAMHIPLISFNRSDNPARRVGNREDLFALLEGRRYLLAVAGHMHTTEHHYFGPEEGFHGHEPLHLHVISTVSGSWWSGPFDERGIPTTVQRDGTPNGFHVLAVDGNRARVRFQAAGKPADHQMRIMLDSTFHRYSENVLRDTRMGELLGSPITSEQAAAAEVLVNLFDGGPNSRVVLRVGEGLPVEMKRVARSDPYVEELFRRHAETIKSWVKPEPSSHLWVAPLPPGLAAGAHTLSVRAEDEYGAVHEGSRVIEIVAPVE